MSEEEDKEKFAFTPDMLKEATKTMDHVETKERTSGVTQMWKCKECGETQVADLEEEAIPDHHGQPMLPFIKEE